MVIVKCDYCGENVNKFQSRVNKLNFCDMKCMNKYNHSIGNPNWKGGLIDKVCIVCGESYQVKISHADRRVTCSRNCSGINKSKKQSGYGKSRVNKICKVCEKEIEVKASHAKIEGTYCSKECMSIGYKTELIGNNNPNWKGGTITKVCKKCGDKFDAKYGQHETRKFCSVSCAAIWRTMNTNPRYGKRSKSGKRDDLEGLYVRSAWEANYARYLNWLQGIGEIDKWEYEPDEFEFTKIKRGARFYLPDFKIFNNDGSVEYHEVKGWMDKKSATKLSRMSKYYPNIKVVLIDKPVYVSIAQQVKNIIPNWES